MKFKFNYFVIIILFSLIVLKVLYFNILFSPISNGNDWIKLYNNYNLNLNFTYFKVDSESVEFSSYKPIFYSVFLIPTIKISFEFVIYLQIILSSLTSYIMYQVVKKIYNSKTGLIFVFLFLFFPLNFYSNLVLNEITIFLFLFSIYLYLLQEFINNKYNIYKIFIYSLTVSLLFLTRSEFILIYLNTLFFLFIYKRINFKNILISILIFILFCSPLILRNIAGNKSYFLSSDNIGINLWQSWNVSKPTSIENKNSIQIDGKSDLLSDSGKIKIENIENNLNWEFEVNKIYFDETIKKFKNDKLEFIKVYFSKIFSLYFWFGNYDFSKMNHFLVILSWLFVIFNFFVFLGTKKNDVVRFQNKIFEKLIIFIIGIYTLILPIYSFLPFTKLIIFPLVCILASENIFQFYKKKLND